ncbi:MAG: lytic transglycosylase domain-containing protein [Cocleimonas sp.]|nr:lytic transglycosylase domain-containing protein [Cocleimonas sp.]
MKLIHTIIAFIFTSLLANTAIAVPHQKQVMLSAMSPSALPEKKKKAKKRYRGSSCLRSVDTVRRKAREIDFIINKSAQRYSVDANLIRAVIAVESCYNARAVSPAGAQGLMQLIPATADRFGVTNSFDVKQNINAGTKYLRFLSKRFNGDLRKVTAGYNAGEGRVDQYSRAPYNGVPPYKETRNYVKNVLRIYGELSGNYDQASLNVDDGLVNRHPASYKGMSAEKRAILSRIRSLGVKSAYQSRKKSTYQSRKRVAPKRKLPPRAIKAQVIHKPVYKNGLRLGGYRKPVSSISELSPRRQRAITRLKALQKKLHVINARSNKTYATLGKPGRKGWKTNRQNAPQLYKRR